MLREVHLGGRLGKIYGKTHRFDIDTPAEAFRALEANHPGFMNQVIELGQQGYGYRILHGHKFKHGVSEPGELLHPCAGPIRIAPEIMGAKNSGIGQLLLAAVVVYAAVQTGGLAAGSFGMSSSVIAKVSTALMSTGIAMGLGGVVQLLAPQQASSGASETKNNPSYVFDGAVNTLAQGHPVPVGYGEMIVGSAVISASVDVEQIQITTSVDSSGAAPTYVNSSGQTVPYPAPTVAWDNNIGNWVLPDGTAFLFDEQVADGAVVRVNFRLVDGRAVVRSVDPDRWDVPSPSSLAVYKKVTSTGYAWTFYGGTVPATLNTVEKRWEIPSNTIVNTQ